MFIQNPSVNSFVKYHVGQLPIHTIETKKTSITIQVFIFNGFKVI